MLVGPPRHAQVAAAFLSFLIPPPVNPHLLTQVSMRLNRPASERKLDPRETPLSHQLGKLCAGIAADASGSHSHNGGNLLHEVSSDDQVNALRERFPVADIGYSVYFNPGLL